MDAQHPPKIHISAQSLGGGAAHKQKRNNEQPRMIKSKFTKGGGTMMDFEDGIIIPLNSKKGTSAYNTQQSEGKPQ